MMQLLIRRRFSKFSSNHSIVVVDITYKRCFPTAAAIAVREHIEYYSRIRGISGHRLVQEVAAALDRVGLTSLGDRFSSGLSGGQRRRLSLAIALCGSPAIVFCDEPTTGEGREGTFYLCPR